ncbi:MAG TPA: sigma-70 family RNA polymerase sigma factor [Actinophytocola sp.]|uniref:sigma-70 family RNA polymerase sigma factor n=1 Tax=Actinophytocola sp. TaxID=1872138 RepID=UPI002E09B6EF|nr:sigma-70 family RNA polymerase sigma factor [Actinophytocola sp.]
MTIVDEPAVLRAAVAGDQDAFQRLAQPHRRELLVHCYRMLGSLDDAEDAAQETLLKAWRHLARFEGRATLRAWLYRIATNVCLDALDHRARRVLPAALAGPADPALPPAADEPDLPWLQPIPDALLEIPDPDPTADPAAAVLRREHIELAFITAIQHLTPRQRAVLLLRDVLGATAAETAGLLDTTPASVNSALQRARATLATGHRTDPPSPAQTELVDRYVRAWHAADIPALVALLHTDADLAMPPCPSWYHGRDAIAGYLHHLFTGPLGRDLRLLPTAANRQPALAVHAGGEPLAIKVLTISGGLITAITGFTDPRLFTRFALGRSPG